MSRATTATGCSSISSTSSTSRESKRYPEVELLSFAKAKADRAAAELLGLAAGDSVYRIRNRLEPRRHRRSSSTTSRCRSPTFPGLTERQFRHRSSTIYNLYQEAFGISVVRASERLRATLADAETAALLSIARGSPLLRIRRIALSYNDVPIELRISLVDTARYEYFADIGKPTYSRLSRACPSPPSSPSS